VGLQTKNVGFNRGKGYQSWAAYKNPTKIKTAKIDSNEVIPISKRRTENTISCKHSSLEIVKRIRPSKCINF
jgi:hypothetical protein